jgi:biofilm PGA synthesis N-glycosyltransferase PgaC
MSDQDRRFRVVALIAAHNEEEHLARTLAALRAQTRPADRVLVMADNCTDRTVEIAKECGVEVVETHDNTARKAGALNQGFALLRDQGFDVVVQLDADTAVEPEFIEAALAELRSDGSLGGVCARFFPQHRPGLLGALQRLEYARYDHSRMRKGGYVSVLSGTAAALRVSALPARPWSETSLVEDYVLTLDLRRRGWNVRAGTNMIAHTDSMPTLAALWRQRIRWTRGTIEELIREGWKPWTRADVLAQISLMAAIVIRLLGAAALIIAAAGHTGMRWSPFWLIPLALVVLDGLVSTKRLPWRDRLLVLLVIPEELYNTLRHAWTCKAAILALAGSETAW